MDPVPRDVKDPFGSFIIIRPSLSYINWLEVVPQNECCHDVIFILQHRETAFGPRT